jgi:hemerythrin-like metal-binding protein
MEGIRWTDEFSVGVAEMDSQHQQLIGMINRLIREQKVVTDAQTIAEMLTAMTDYARQHFRAEEFLLAEYGYTYKDLQVQQHQEFIEKTREFYANADVGANILSKALLEFLKTWLTRHILEEDMKYKGFLRLKGVK